MTALHTYSYIVVHTQRGCHTLKKHILISKLFFMNFRLLTVVQISALILCLFFTYLLTYLLTPWSRVFLEKLTGSAASQEIPHILWNPKVHYRTQKCPSPLPILSQLHPVPTTPSHLCLVLPNCLFPSNLPTRTLCKPLPSPIRSTCPAHLFLLIASLQLNNSVSLYFKSLILFQASFDSRCCHWNISLTQSFR